MAYGLRRTREEPRLRGHYEWESVRAEDLNDVVILQDVADVAKARTWLASDEMKAAREKGGVVGSPNIRFAA
jgi:hypothetical protein